ncbi:LysM domain-containing protein [Paenibacillus sp. BK033]|uniref:cell wall hydrolase n=1 Tax=Paenibacillus sp. BK033 TaxID=2512133 RepID=UPI0010442E56|nr:cell wall hydrolase [Paenibacillus sp. BK033]TCN01131.1 LysM domain-containing protein [Paenibacillus sp. BK033]
MIIHSMQKSVKIMSCVMALALLWLSAGPLASVSAAEAGATVRVNGENAKLSDSIITQKNRMYVPAARIATMLGAEISWDSNNEELTIDTAYNDEVVFGNGVPVVYFNDSRYKMDAVPFMEDGRMYVPLRQLADVLHADLSWDTDSNTAKLTEVDRAAVTEEYGLAEISKEYGISAAALLKRNGFNSKDQVKPGTKLKVIIPSFLDNPASSFTQSDLTLLAKISQIEAGRDSYEGQLAIANVILNRVKDSRFPDSIHDVIYSGKQFPPAHNGLLDKSKPNAGALRAAKDALNGRNNVYDAVYFYNPNVTRGAFWSNLEVVARIGGHNFAR